jgi:hypothetical protein
MGPLVGAPAGPTELLPTCNSPLVGTDHPPPNVLCPPTSRMPVPVWAIVTSPPVAKRSPVSRVAQLPLATLNVLVTGPAAVFKLKSPVNVLSPNAELNAMLGALRTTSLAIVLVWMPRSVAAALIVMTPVPNAASEWNSTPAELLLLTLNPPVNVLSPPSVIPAALANPAVFTPAL